MANQAHLEHLMRGAEWWNEWRANNAEIRPDLGNADFSNSDLSGLDLRGSDLYRADLHSAIIRGADLSGANLQEADLRETDLATTDLSSADLSWAYLVSTNLPETKLVKTNFFEANLAEADLRRADLTGSRMRRANLAYTILDFAVLHGADLRGADLDGAHMRETDFTDATLGWTGLGRVELKRARGLDSCNHQGPSYIDVATLYLNATSVSAEFFRRAGVPENLLVYLSSLVAEPIQFYSCFISYSTDDQVFAERLHADLQACGVRSWFAPHDMRGGKKLHDQIADAIRVYDRLLLVLSPSSMRSEWVKTEISTARAKEAAERRRVLFPISLVPFQAIRQWKCFDADRGKDSASEIREYHIPNFTGWRNESEYRTAFQRLIRDLRPLDSVDAAPNEPR